MSENSEPPFSGRQLTALWLAYIIALLLIGTGIGTVARWVAGS
jgi:hypothetical protein